MKDFRHGGNLREMAAQAGLEARELTDFSANINPLGPPAWLRSVISSSLSSVIHYPDPYCVSLTEALAAAYGVSVDEVLVGNGATELLYLLPRALSAARAVIPVPAYVDYAEAAGAAGLKIQPLVMREEENFTLNFSDLESTLQQGDMVFVASPNNPTGMVCNAEALRELAARHEDCTFVMDESFGDFVDDIDSLVRRRPANVAVLISFTKIFAIPGLRLGCIVAAPEWVRRTQDIQPPWSVNNLAQAVGQAAVKDRDFVVRSRTYVSRQRDRLLDAMGGLKGFSPYPGSANFLLVRIDRTDIDARDLFRRLLKRRLAIRVCDNYEGLDSRFFRVAVRPEDDNKRLVQGIEDALGMHAPLIKRKTPAVMFQGTSSNAGKSILSAAFCRILLQDGFRVAPFKAQNMSLNSFVTADGGEMGRAQVVQAQACRLDPDVRMNPILLKPVSDTGCQVIQAGRPVGNMRVAEYVKYKPEAFENVKKAYDCLARDFNVIVLEGAGSPAEMNLKSHDIVNMQMARHAGADVLLVGDIDRGGVFASFIGTMEVLEEWERSLVRGFVVNRFRGDASLLKSALEYTADYTGRPVLGVVPFIPDLGLPEEDSVEFKSGSIDGTQTGEEEVKIAVVDLPHISNFNDFDPLRLEPDVSVKIVRNAADLDDPDAVILPGSKSVMGDLKYLRDKGLTRKIMDLAGRGKTEVIGICAGFQMVGREIHDPHGIESAEKTIQGLNLLPVSTTLAPEKTLTRTRALHLPSKLDVRGYEIHHGLSEIDGGTPVVQRPDGEVIGSGQTDGLVWGTYLHGIFDCDEFRRWFVDRLRTRRGLPALAKVVTRYDMDEALDRLADVVRQSLPVDEIYRSMGV